VPNRFSVAKRTLDGMQKRHTAVGAPGLAGTVPPILHLYQETDMSIAAHLAELERRHQTLEAEIAEARTHPSIDNLQIVALKRRKLLLKDEIVRLQN